MISNLRTIKGPMQAANAATVKGNSSAFNIFPPIHDWLLQHAR